MDAILRRLPLVKRAADESFHWCPFHPDGQGKAPHAPNLRLNEQKEVWFCDVCGRGGNFRELADELGLTEKRQVEATYDYFDLDGKKLFQVVRFEGKKFAQRRRAPDNWRECDQRTGCSFAKKCNSGFIWSLEKTPCLPSVRRVIYKLPEILARSNDPVWIVEGEKDVECLRQAGLLATTNPGGAGKWKDSYSESLRGRRIIILPDNDNAGREHAEMVARGLHGIASSVKVLELPGLGDKGDTSDWLAGGGNREALLMLVEVEQEWTPAPKSEAAEPKALSAVLSYDSLLTKEEPEIEWLIDKLLPKGGIGVLSGDAGTGKTWVMLHIAQCLALGLPVFGKFRTWRGRVLVWDEEGTLALLQQRIYQLHRGLEEPGEVQIDFVVGQGWRLDVKTSYEALRAELAVRKPLLVMGDSFIRLHGADENSATAIAAVFSIIRGLMKDFGCGFFLTHHTRKISQVSNAPSQMLRGSTDIRASVDSHLYLRQSGEGQLLFDHEKSRFGAAVESFVVALADEEGAVRLNYQGPTGLVLGKVEQIKDRILQILVDMQEPITRKSLIDQLKGEEFRERKIAEAMGMLSRSGEIVKVGMSGKMAVYGLPHWGLDFVDSEEGTSAEGTALENAHVGE